MAARLNNVLYWSFSGLALLVIAFVGYLAIDDTKRGVAASNDLWALVFAVLVAVVLWLIGRACRYVLAGR